jgi:predicted ester cyclase
LRTAFPDIKFIIKDQFAEGDKVVTHFITQGTHQGNFQGVPPTGKSFKVSAIDIDYIKNGKVSDCWSNLDELSLLQQLGIVS